MIGRLGVIFLLVLISFDVKAKIAVNSNENNIVVQKGVDIENMADDVKEKTQEQVAPEINNIYDKNEGKSRLEIRREELAKERAMETSRFKKKAIENTERRERKHEEILKRKLERESRFQRAAREREERERKEAIEREKNKEKSRFTKKAEERAEERAERKEEKEMRLKRNQNK